MRGPSLRLGGALCAVSLVLVAACESKDSGGDPDSGGVVLPPDAAPPDAPPDAPPPPIDAAPPADAMPPNTACMNDPPPGGTVPATITISGSAQTIMGQQPAPVADATASALARSGDASLATGTTDSAGAFSLPITTGGAAVDGYLKFEKSGYLTTYLFPPDPLRADLAIPDMGVIMLTPGTLALLDQLPGVTIQAGDAVAIVNVVDCLGVPQTGIDITIVGGDQDTGSYDVGTLVPQFPIVLIYNIPVMKDGQGNPIATEVTIKAKYNNSIDFQDNTVKVFPDSMTITQVHP